MHHVPQPSGPDYPALPLGPLPVAAVNRVLGTELEPGNVRLSPKAHRHMAEVHPADYPICIAALAQAVAAPTFIGQAPHHAGNFEMIRRVGLPDGRVVLVAIGLEPDAKGEYRVRTCYLISADQVDARRRAGRLKALLP